ncbi:MAG: alpha-amylase [Muribaculaceae bacterium]|nr:alpha-amylase [Muribaculaceae bacterium]
MIPNIKKNIKASFATVVTALTMTGCTSYEIDMPVNPAEPIVGNEVSTNVIYQANPRFFGEHECLKALTAQLPRISEMGCDIVWIMPVFTTGEQNSIGSPYCIRDFKSVNPRYGTMADLKELVNSAHSKGMKVMLDWVANHTSWDHPWITEHTDRYDKDSEGHIVSPEGWPDVAQLDFNNSATCTAMAEAMSFWVEQAGIDGFRCDYVEGVPQEFWSKTIADLHASHPELIMLAETGNAAYYADGFDMIYDWNCTAAISAAFNGGKPAEVVKEAEEALAKVPDGKSILRYAFNHDVAADNNIDRLFGSAEAIPAAYVLASMFNGTPMIYSSMDVKGLSGKLSFFNYNPLEFSSELTAVYKKINDAFRNSAEVRRGELRDYSGSSVVCFTRSIPGHSLLVAVNTENTTQTVRTPITLAGATMTDLIDSKTIAVPVTLELQPYSYTILMN